MLRALAGLMMIICGGLISSAIIIPKPEFPPALSELSSTWQISGLLLCALVCGPRPAVIASFAYLTIGLFFFPIFHGGGSVGYILTPGFGYLIGFIPAAWFSGHLTLRTKRHNLIKLTLIAILGLIILQLTGIIYLIIGCLFGLWENTFIELLYLYTLAPLPSQLALCTAVGIIALIMRIILII